MSKNYHPAEIEKKWRKKWGAKPLYQAEDFSKRKKYYALVEFPYPSGEGLHIGHAFTNTILDVFARQKRAEGFNVLHPMGWDAFGLPTENSAIKYGVHPVKLTARNTKRFRQQNERMAISYDWSREIDTTDPNYYKWTQWIFIQLFKHGLAYKQETPVGWCPACKIILANEEIVAGNCERCGCQAEYRQQKQWLLRITRYADRLAEELAKVDYPAYIKTSQRGWIGRKEWVDITYPVVGTKETLTVSTTRPDTNFGATFIVMAPEHPLLKPEKGLVPEKYRQQINDYIAKTAKKSELERISELRKKTGVFTGLYTLNQLNGRKIPIWVTDFVLASVGTGAVVGVPGHDLRDFDFAQQFGLAVVRVVVGADGDKTPITRREQVQEKEGIMINSEFLNGMDVHRAIEKMKRYLEEKGWGKRVIRYHLRDWIFSRQHYWGEPFPIVYCPACAARKVTWWDTPEGKKLKPLFKLEEKEKMAGWMPLKKKDLPLKLPEIEKYQPTVTGESPLANAKTWVKTRCPHCGGDAQRETDTMPNWAGSSWYFLRYCDALNNSCLADKKKLSYWLPVDLYLGGAEHTTLHLLYSRFWHKFLNDIGAAPGQEPYAARRQHGVILGEDGQRMSKSRGNIINPEIVMDKFGVDTLRVYLLFMGPYDATMPWSTKGLEGAYRFLARIWKMYQEKDKIGKKTPPQLARELHKTIKKVGKDIKALKHNTAIAALMELLNSWQKENFLSLSDAKTFLILLAPFAPYLAEELWTTVLKQKYSVHHQAWPKHDPQLVKEEKTIIVIQVNGKLRGQMKIAVAKAKEKEIVAKQAKAEKNVAKYLKKQPIKKTIFVPERLINFVI